MLDLRVDGRAAETFEEADDGEDPKQARRRIGVVDPGRRAERGPGGPLGRWVVIADDPTEPGGVEQRVGPAGELQVDQCREVIAPDDDVDRGEVAVDEPRSTTGQELTRPVEGLR